MTSQTTEAVRGPHLGGEAVGVGLFDQVAVVTALHLVLVDFTLAEIGNEDLPDAGGAAVSHRVAAAVPVIEVADHADALGVRGPDGEIDAVEALMGPDMGAKPLVISVVCSFAQEVKVKVGEDGAEQVGIDKIPGVPLVVLDLEPVGKRLAAGSRTRPRRSHRGGPASSEPSSPGSPAFKSTTQADWASGRNARTTQRFFGAGARRQLVQPKDRERVPVVRMNDQVDLCIGDRRDFCRFCSHVNATSSIRSRASLA